MEFKLFKLDIDELINEFAQCRSTSFAEFKKVWLSKTFSFIFEASPSVGKGCFMQMLYAHSIEELRRLKNLAREAKMVGAGAVSAILKKMLERNMLLFGSTSISEDSAMERMDELNDRVMQKYQKLFPDTNQLERFIHADLGAELEVDSLKNDSSEYSAAKELAIKEASKVIDVENIKHIAENKELIGDGMEKTAAEWNSQKELFYQRKGFGQHQKDDEDDDDFGRELEEALLFEPVD